jgi:hypothetical protein
MLTAVDADMYSGGTTTRSNVCGGGVRGALSGASRHPNLTDGWIRNTSTKFPAGFREFMYSTIRL